MKRNRIAGIMLAAANGILILVCAVLYLGKDRQEPELIFEAAQTVYREGMEKEELIKGVRARDAEDGDISGRIVIEKISENREENTAVVFYAVSDRAGNVARASRVFAAVYAQQRQESVESRFLDAGIEAELKEGNIVNTGGGEEAGNHDGGGDEESGVENTQEKTPEPSASPEPVTPPRLTQGRAPSVQGQPSPEPATGRETGREQEEKSLTVARETGSMPQEIQERGAAPEENRQQGAGPEAEPEPARDPEQETGDTSAGQPPVLTLKTSEVEVKAGQGPAWVDLIGTLSDDKDGYEILFGNLNVSRYDRSKPGSYQVSVFTEDSDGNRSEAVPLTIIVK